MKKLVIFGLGNPGEKYTNTRHNIGFQFLDAFLTLKLGKSNMKGYPELEAYINKDIVYKKSKIILVKPNTFMNNSGQAISKVMNYFNILKEDILVIHDDIDIPFGSIRFSKDSGPAGHNGIKSIIEYLGTKDFVRLRVGIANKLYEKQDIPSEKFVLANFESQEKKMLDGDLYEKIIKAIDFYIENGFEETKNKYNKSAMPLIELR